MKQCIFCFRELLPVKVEYSRTSAFICRNCKFPNYNTLYRQLYWKDKPDLLVDLTVVDNLAVGRYFQGFVRRNYSIIYRKPSMEPACKISFIIPLDISNLESFKHKLTTWITFS